MGRLEGKVAIVTGGASGIGLAIAKAYAGEGARVCIADLSRERCDEAAAAIGGSAFGQALDVRDRRSIAALVDRVVAEAGEIDILLNSAGVFGMKVFTDITEEDFDRIIGVNTRGLLFTTQAVAHRMIAQGRGGAIVNIASSAGKRASPGSAIYSASKAAVISLTQCAALELIHHGIRVNAIAPGIVETPMWRTQVEPAFKAVLGPGAGTAEQALISATPIGRMSAPEEYAGPAILLASQEGSYIVGQTLVVDGGMFLN